MCCSCHHYRKLVPEVSTERHNKESMCYEPVSVESVRSEGRRHCAVFVQRAPACCILEAASRAACWGRAWVGGSHAEKERQAGPGPRKLGVSPLSLRSLVIEHLLCA